MPGDTGRRGAAPRQTRARAGASTGVQTRRAGGRDARVPAPAPDAEDIESDTRDREGAVVLPGGRVGASGNSSSNSDNDYQELDGGQTAQAEDVDPAEENIPQEEGGAAAANDRGAAGAVPETDIEQERIRAGEREENEAIMDSRGVSRALVSGFLAGDTSPDTRRGRPTSRFYMDFIASVEVPSYGLTMLGLLRGDPQRSMSYLLGCVRASSPGNQG